MWENAAEQVQLALDRVMIRAGGRRKRRRRPRPFRRFATRAALVVTTIVLAVAFPFVAMLGVSTRLYVQFGWHQVPAILCGAAVATVIVAAYARYVARRLGYRASVTPVVLRMVGLVVGAYLVWTLVYISAANVKTADLRSTYMTTHPLLRMSLATLVLVDEGSVVTDLARSREDYARMGLPVNERSLHFRQIDGYSHAVDLRTNGRSEIRNALVALYFRAIGMTTIRHVGTGDHLHVSLPLRYRAG